MRSLDADAVVTHFDDGAGFSLNTCRDPDVPAGRVNFSAFASRCCSI